MVSAVDLETLNLQAREEPCTDRCGKGKDTDSRILFLSQPLTTLLIFSLLLKCDDGSFGRKAATSEQPDRQLAGSMWYKLTQYWGVCSRSSQLGEFTAGANSMWAFVFPGSP